MAGEAAVVIIERSGGSFRFAAPRTWLKADAPGCWFLDMPSITRNESAPDIAPRED
jgi:hypothetical protein